jgi:hypothetical protein
MPSSPSDQVVDVAVDVNVEGDTNTTLSTSFAADDILRANTVWSEEDVKCSAQGLDRRRGRTNDQDTIVTPEFAHNPNRAQAMMGLHTGIQSFWKRYQARFASVWRGMTPTARRFLLLTIAPEMAVTGSEEECYGQLTLIPEFVVEQLATQPDPLLTLLSDVATTELRELYFMDAQYIRRLIQTRALEPDMAQQYHIGLLQGGSIVGETMQFNTDRATAVNINVDAKIQEMVSKGWAIEGGVWSHVTQRRTNLLLTLAILLDEMRTNVFGKDPKLMKRSLQCSKPTCTTIQQANRKSLMLCSRCKVSAYCSRECQVGHWKQHKLACSGQKKK